MKLNRGDKVRYNGNIYETVAVLWSTVYLQRFESRDSIGECYEMEEVYNNYKDVEFL